MPSKILVHIAQEGLIFLVCFYQVCISPLFPASCRFFPTCSQYTIDAIRQYGPWAGLYLGVRRILRCHPLSSGGYDPVNQEK